MTDHVTPHNQNDGLFRTAGQPDDRQLTPDVTDIRPIARASRGIFHHAIDHEAAEHPRLITQRDEVTMRSLRFPFDEDNCR
ncbi:MAG: hypothetical protein M3460_26440 [Actinomycetota bacterium]|nr:hypothetical protein [Actinomycetota bacterium]